MRKTALRSGILLSVLAVAVNTFVPHAGTVRRNAVQVLAAAAGGAPTTDQAAALHTSAAQADAAALFASSMVDSPRPGASFRVVLDDEARGSGGGGGGGGDSDGASSWGVGDHESLIALYLQTVLWPLFDNDLRQLKALKSSWTAPQRVLDAWEADVQEPHLIWTPDVRCDARVVASAEPACRDTCGVVACFCRADIQRFLKADWETLATFFSKHPHSEAQYDSMGVLDRLPRDAISSHLRVGDVFVRRFNRKPFFKSLDPQDFLLALLQHQDDDHDVRGCGWPCPSPWACEPTSCVCAGGGKQ